jgi:deoxyguanosine kinase
MSAARYFAIEGLIGVGKTSLCRLLERRWGARLVLEPWEHNPFLRAFYEDRERFAFPAQMFYLATRFSQQLQLKQPDLFSPVVVADYLYQKDRLFAEETLSGDELALYDRFAGLLGDSVPSPDFVVFLDAPTEVIQARIRKRAIEAEQVIEGAYLDSLRRRYYALWDRYDEAPVYVLDTRSVDYVENRRDQDFILDLITGWLEGRPTAGSPRPYRERRDPVPNLFGSPTP